MSPEVTILEVLVTDEQIATMIDAVPFAADPYLSAHNRAVCRMVRDKYEQDRAERQKVVGEYVPFADHEAAIIKAKIEVLEEVAALLCRDCSRRVHLVQAADPHNKVHSLPGREYRHCEASKIHVKIKELQAQLGEAGR